MVEEKNTSVRLLSVVPVYSYDSASWYTTTRAVFVPRVAPILDRV